MNQESLTSGVQNYYNNKQNDRNLRMSGDTGIINHHFGMGDYDRNEQLTQEKIASILNDMEMKQLHMLFGYMLPIKPDERILDAGCGRGGTSFSLANQFGVTVDGITISPYQRDFASQLAQERGWDKRVTFHLMNYLRTTFEANTFDHVVTNETTQYALTLEPLFTEFNRVLKPNGRYTIATWCINERENNPYIDPINEHYGVVMHTREEYVQALESTGYKVLVNEDVTEDATPYWELRRSWNEKSGIEDAFHQGHLENKILYCFIQGVKV